MCEKSRVLVVDDDDVVRLSFQRSLSGACCNVQGACDGDNAIRLMEAQSFDLVLLDLRMPGADGMAVLKIIKERWPDSEVVVITGYPTVETAKEAVRLGAYDYLSKPLGPVDVINIADGAITHKKWALQRDNSDPDRPSISSVSWDNSLTH